MQQYSLSQYAFLGQSHISIQVSPQKFSGHTIEVHSGQSISKLFIQSIQKFIRCFYF